MNKICAKREREARSWMELDGMSLFLQSLSTFHAPLNLAITWENQPQTAPPALCREYRVALNTIYIFSYFLLSYLYLSIYLFIFPSMHFPSRWKERFISIGKQINRFTIIVAKEKLTIRENTTPYGFMYSPITLNEIQYSKFQKGHLTRWGRNSTKPLTRTSVRHSRDIRANGSMNIGPMALN